MGLVLSLIGLVHCKEIHEQEVLTMQRNYVSTQNPLIAVFCTYRLVCNGSNEIFQTVRENPRPSQMALGGFSKLGYVPNYSLHQV